MVEIMELKIAGLELIKLLTNKINDYGITCTFKGSNTTVDATRTLIDKGDNFLYTVMYDNGDVLHGHGLISSRSFTHNNTIELNINGDEKVIWSPVLQPEWISVGADIICPDGAGKIVYIEGGDVAVSCDGRLSVFTMSAIKPLPTRHDKLVEEMSSDITNAKAGFLNHTCKEICAELIKAGYRKINPDNLMLLDDVLISEVEYKYEALKELIARLK